MDGITRLAATYIKLCHAGSVLFQDCNIKFMCNPNKKPHTVVDFPLAKGMLFSTLATEMDVNHQIRSLSNFMEQCLDEWLQYVNKNRQVISISCISKSIILSGTARKITIFYAEKVSFYTIRKTSIHFP